MRQQIWGQVGTKPDLISPTALTYHTQGSWQMTKRVNVCGFRLLPTPCSRFLFSMLRMSNGKQPTFKFTQTGTGQPNERAAVMMASLHNIYLTSLKPVATWDTCEMLHTNLKNSQSVGVSQSLRRRHVGPAVSSVQVHTGYQVQLWIHPVQTPVGYIWDTHTHTNEQLM